MATARFEYDDETTFMTCENCGREIKGYECPYCDFGYKRDEDENGVFYY